ncbi:hypothetical protein IMZ48_19180 [Candidatus Bathyarchaeota archaeon]|nr:hypothetical protein [Candidatus Bathyarchaeota archaeon]
MSKMKPSYLILSILPLAHGVVNGRCSGSKATNLWHTDGICISTESCNSFGGKHISGACPDDPENIKCCRIEGTGSQGCA